MPFLEGQLLLLLKQFCELALLSIFFFEDLFFAATLFLSDRL